MGLLASKPKDSTALGVAKVRMIEYFLDEGARAFSDPYAQYMCPGATIMQFMGYPLLHRLYDKVGLGMYDMLAVRTAWLDGFVMDAVTAGGARQYLILAAGYDCRGFRLKLPTGVRVFEVDQPEVQESKRAKVAKIPDLPARVASITYVPVDLNTMSLEAELQKAGFDARVPTVVTMEGLLQYIPKESTAATFNVLGKICAPGSRLGVSYVDQGTYEDDPRVIPSGYAGRGGFKSVLEQVAKVGEPWITGFTPSEFASFVAKESGFQVTSERALAELNETMLKPLGRKCPPENLLQAERFAEASI